MIIVETDTDDSGHPTFLLEKGNATGTLIVAIKTGPAKFRFRYLLTDRPLTARDTSIAWRAVIDREAHNLRLDE